MGPLFRFALITDTHLVDEVSAEPLRAAIRLINQEGPDFVVLNGDMTNQGSAEQYAVLQECLRGLTVPCRMVPGNHDLGKTGATEEDEGTGGRFEELFGPRNACWEIAGHTCLSLDTNNNDGPENWHGRVEAPALAWLRAALAETDPARPLLLFSHHGMVGRPEDLSRDVENAEEALAAFEGRKLVAGFCGHGHRLGLHRLGAVPFFATPALSMVRECHGCPPGFLMVDVHPGGVRARFEVAVF